jgi:hypothetical protein
MERLLEKSGAVALVSKAMQYGNSRRIEEIFLECVFDRVL